MEFYEALRLAMTNRCAIYREGWNGKNLRVCRVNDPRYGTMFIIVYPNYDVRPWVPSNSDLIANDWLFEASSIGDYIS
jgi:hypothetical protein